MSATTRDADAARGHLWPSSALRLAPVLEAELRLDTRNTAVRAGVLRRLLALGDILAALSAGFGGALAGGLGGVEILPFVALMVCGWALVAFAGGLYAADDLSSWASGIGECGRLGAMVLVLSWPLAGGAWLQGADAPVAAALVGSVLLLVVAPTTRAVARAVVHRSAPLRQRTLILGSGYVAGQIVDRLRRHQEYGLEPIGLVDDDAHPGGSSGLPVLGGFADLRQVLSEHAVDRVIIAFSLVSHEKMLESIRACRQGHVALDVVPRLFEFLEGARSLDQIGGMPLMSLGPQRLSRTSQLAKRSLDVAVASTALTVCVPLFALIAVAIKLGSDGPVLFSQPRAGRDGRPFRLLKLRTMIVDADERKGEGGLENDLSDGVMFKMHADPRVTRVGRLLRRLSLDELPQLVNVARGQMSLVGPRPLILSESEALGEGWHARRFDLRPGLTGPWQIAGRSDLTVHEMVRMDYQYVTGWSLGRDLAILAATLPAVAVGRGAY
jgi:exopolysaccharide biosynthesis polyprenyl glycosylphosphotransferase